MSHDETSGPGREPFPPLDRREMLAYSASFGTAFLAAQGLVPPAQADQPDYNSDQQPSGRPRKQYDMKKSFNLWALPYPEKMSLKECFELAAEAGFDAVEVNYALEGDLSPKASHSDLKQIGRTAREAGVEISGLCSFLYWPYSLTSNDPTRRKKGLELASQMIAAAKALGTSNLLVIAGSVYIPWLSDREPVPNDLCDRRAKQAMRKLLPEAQQAGVSLNVENIFANGYLLSPSEMNTFVDHFASDAIGVHFDTGNIMQYQFPEHWIRQLGGRIRNVHFKEYSKKVHEFTLDTFRPLLDGTTNWPAVMAALDEVGYRGYLTFEYFNPFPHWPEALVYQTSDALDRMLGRKG